MKEVSYAEAKACYNIAKNRYSDKLASELYIARSPILPQYYTHFLAQMTQLELD